MSYQVTCVLYSSQLLYLAQYPLAPAASLIQGEHWCAATQQEPGGGGGHSGEPPCGAPEGTTGGADPVRPGSAGPRELPPPPAQTGLPGYAPAGIEIISPILVLENHVHLLGLSCHLRPERYGL